MPGGQRRIVRRRGDTRRARRERRELRRMPVPRRDAAEQRRAARGGVGAVDRVQLDVERIGQ
ncbi:Uncharacterised protein [Burkholderia mallei]|nr:hypothetical protein DM57_2348 [Burkholderia mallei]AIP76642.1 hypothetical protein DM51_117 [Burkholderia mallei]AJX64189.1 hypothetical protein BM94_1672 [Burkholderia mallei]AJY36025.1 hypothetical protein BO07_2063 [Burkholderia mallei]ATE31488.1 hypothetical protein RY28_01490 [Burkholderia mallei]